jgi:hypothetical protein
MIAPGFHPQLRFFHHEAREAIRKVFKEEIQENQNVKMLFGSQLVPEIQQREEPN